MNTKTVWRVGAFVGLTMGIAACGDDTTGVGGAGGDASSTGVTSGSSTHGSSSVTSSHASSANASTTSSTSTTSNASSSSTGGEGGGGGCPTTAPDATRGSPIALSPDDSTLVVANRDSGSVTVMHVDYASGLPALTVTAELAVGAEPWQVAIDGCSDKAYVVLRKDQKLVEIDDIQTTATVGPLVSVGSEPTGLALSPNNNHVYVANWVEGTVSVVDLPGMTVTSTIDLNAALAGTGLLGPTVSAASARPAIAHPRSIAVTNDGDTNDDNEKILVTEFFAQRTEPEGANGINSDENWEGLVYSIGVNDLAVGTIALPPVTGIQLEDALPITGCFPNQLQSITVRGGQAFVTSICASPKGPTGVKQNTHPAVHVVDIGASSAVGINLDTAWNGLYVDNFFADDATRRYPLVSNDVALDPASGAAFITANGADALFRGVFDTSGALTEVGAGAADPFLDLASTDLDAAAIGQNPVGVAIGRTNTFAFVSNEVSRNVTAIDLGGAAPEIAGAAANDARVAPSTPLPVADADLAWLRGKQAFDTGLGRWSQNGQAWGACQTCHFDGLSDNVTWYFGKGARQSTSIEGSFASLDPTDQRIFNWTAVFDEVADFENVARGIDGAVGGLVHTLGDPPVVGDRIDLTSIVDFPPAGAANLNGSADAVSTDISVVHTWEDMEVFMQRVRSPRAPVGLDPALVAAGKMLFEADSGGRCQGCHGGPKWTISKRFYDPSGSINAALNTLAWNGDTLVANGFPAALLPATTGNQFMRYAAAGGDQIQCVLRDVSTYGVSPADVNALELRTDMSTPGQGNAANGLGFNVPSILGMSVGAPYFHAGNARTLEESLDVMFAGHTLALSPSSTFLDGANDKAALVAYLLSIDETTAPDAIPTEAGAFGGVFCASP